MQDNFYVPKFGDLGNSEPAKQAEITVNTYLDKREKNVRVVKAKVKPGFGVVFPYGLENLNDRTFSVRENEPAFIRREKNAKNHSFSIAKQFNIPKHDNYAHVFSSLNGLYLHVPTAIETNWMTLPEELRKYYVRDCLTLVGTIGTSYDATTAEGKVKYSYFPTRLGGVFAMRAGSKDIKAGDVLVVDAPKTLSANNPGPYKMDHVIAPYSKDIDPNKAFMEIVPFDVDQIPTYELVVEFFDEWLKDNIHNDNILKSYAEHVKHMDKKPAHVIEVFFFRVLELLAFKKGNDMIEDNWIDNVKDAWKDVKKTSVLKNLMDSFFGIRTEINRRAIGVAMTSAKPGCQVDVYVTHGYAV